MMMMMLMTRTMMMTNIRKHIVGRPRRFPRQPHAHAPGLSYDRWLLGVLARWLCVCVRSVRPLLIVAVCVVVVVAVVVVWLWHACAGCVRMCVSVCVCVCARARARPCVGGRLCGVG